MTPLFQRASAVAVGTVTNLVADRPWRSKTVRFAVLIVVIGIAFWLRHAFQGTTTPGAGGGTHFDRPFPWYVRLAISYIGGFLIGWTFRRFVKLLFLAVILIATLFGAAKFAGCDATPLQSRVGHETEVVKKQAERERDYLKGLLPSSAAAGLGVFWGFWRRSRGLLATVPPEVADGPPPPLKGAG